MMKHIGLHNAQKVTIILHQMPTEDHMCLVVYDNKVPSPYFQKITETLRTPEGQAAKDFATALEGVYLDDGRNLAFILYHEGHLKKVPCNQVFATPFGYENPNKVKLNELNDHLKKIEDGGAALERMQELENDRGMHKKVKGKTKNTGKEGINEALEALASKPVPSLPVRHTATPTLPIGKTPELNTVSLPAAAADASAQLRQHADLLKGTAAQLLQQAKQLSQKAEQIFPSPKKNGPGRPKGTGKKALAAKASAIAATVTK